MNLSKMSSFCRIIHETTLPDGEKGLDILYGDLISNNGVEALFCVDDKKISFEINKTKFYEPKKDIYGWDEIILPVS